VRRDRLFRLAFQANSNAFLVGFLARTVVLLDSLIEVFSALGVGDVLDADVDPLGNDLSSESLVDNDADSMLRHVEHSTGLAVVELVGHAFLDSTITLKESRGTHQKGTIYHS
jgi:hypothetical protein